VSAAVSLSRAVEAITGYIPKIKWVNDLQMNSKKVAGILTEGLAESESHLKYAIVGIGVNVYKRDFSDEISSIATSIEDATGKRISREELISTLIKEMLSLRDFASDIEYYREHSSVIGKDITVFRGGECFDAHALDVTDDGELSVRLSDGSEVLLFSGEISVRNK
jgi:BirA family biotin operon repressor/biotin-[acetyl-CoA-carboxylase] ligase